MDELLARKVRTVPRRLLALTPELATTVHHRLAGKGITGGAAYDALVALAAHENNIVLATRDARAKSTYEVLGAEITLL
jgi:predicted nucleic acid-binding protein